MSAPRPKPNSAAPSDQRLWVATALLCGAAIAVTWFIIVSTDGSGRAGASPATTPLPATTAAPTVAAPTTTVTDADAEVVSVVEAATVTDESTLPFDGLRIEVVGDSLAASAADELRDRFDTDDFGIDVEPGRPLRAANAAFNAAAANDPDVVVVVLGTNDWDGPANYDEQLDAAAARLVGVPCVVWADAQEFRPGLESVNVDIAEAADRHGWLVARWSAFAGPAELHTTDGYHLSSEGQALLADLIVATVADGCTFDA